MNSKSEHRTRAEAHTLATLASEKKTVNDRVPPKYKLSMTNFQYESAVQN